MAFFLVSCCHGLHQAVRGAAAAVPCLSGRHTRLAHNQPDDMTPEALAKREARARKLAQRQSPEGVAAAAAAATAAADAKRAARRERDVREAAMLREWGVRGVDGAPMPLVDIGANLVKLKDPAALAHQLRRCQLTGVSRVLVTGTSVEASRRALELAATTSAAFTPGRRALELAAAGGGVKGAHGAAGAEGARLFCTAGVHPHEAKGFGPSTLESLRPLLRAAECVAVGESGLDYDRMFSSREAQLP
jgi:TatD DNase family protein